MNKIKPSWIRKCIKTMRERGAQPISMGIYGDNYVIVVKREQAHQIVDIIADAKLPIDVLIKVVP